MSLSAVITADIVNSTRLAKAEARKVIKNLSLNLKDHLYEFSRGDSLQVYVKNPADALMILIKSRAMVIKLSAGVSDIKGSIGIDLVKTPVKEIKTASGEAFVLSGRAFDDLRDQRLIILGNEKFESPNAGFRVISRFTDYLFQRMTAKQAAVVYELLQDKTQMDIARKLKKSQATVNKHIQSAGWTEIEKLLVEYQRLAGFIKQ